MRYELCDKKGNPESITVLILLLIIKAFGVLVPDVFEDLPGSLYRLVRLEEFRREFFVQVEELASLALPPAIYEVHAHFM